MHGPAGILWDFGAPADMMVRMERSSDDYDLLRQYVDAGSEVAFASLVRRHTDMVYSAAVRHVGRGGMADEVTQAVFILLMRKAPGLPRGVVLAAWLFKATRYTSLNALRAATRRRHYEQEAGHMAMQRKQPHTAWPDVEPLLDEAIARLSTTDRTAVVLRYLERRSLAEVGQALGVTENAAHMRVQRATEKLRAFFGRRGVAMTTAALAVLITTQATQAAPTTLTATLSLGALRSAHAAGHAAPTLAGEAARQMLLDRVRSVVVLALAMVMVAAGGMIVLKRSDRLQPALTRPGGSIERPMPPATPLISPAVTVRR